MSRIEVHGLCKSFAGRPVIDDLSLTIENGELFCLFGPPGCGKTLLLKLLLGLERPDAGRILIDGRDVTEAAPASRDMAIVFQNLALFPHLSVRDNIAFPLVERRVTAATVATRVDAIAQTLQIEHLLHKLPGQLSGGERQRVAIGRALVREPNAVLMDEPLSALDARLRETMRMELVRLRRLMGRTFIYVTHDQEEAMALADRLAVMHDGRLRQVDVPEVLYDRPADRHVATLLGAPPINLFPGTIGGDGIFRDTQGLLAVPVDPAVGPRAAATLGVRPENLGRARRTDGGVDGPIVAIEPLGAVTVIDVRLGASLHRALLPGQPSLTVGEQVRLSIVEPRRCLLFDSTPGGRLLGHAAPIGTQAAPVTVP